MMSMQWIRSFGFALAVASGSCYAFASGFEGPGGDTDALVADTLAANDPEMVRYNDHLVTLASPWMEGRVPGSDGMERAKDYCEYYYRAFGLEPAFPAEIEGKMTAFASYRDPFRLGGTWVVSDERLVAMSERGVLDLAGDDDFVFTALGGNGSVSAQAVFCGYSISNGEGDWTSYAEGDDLTGKVAVMFRFEPMDDEGHSVWSKKGWSGKASFDNKIGAAVKRGAAAVVVINPPGTDDERAGRLNRFRTNNGKGAPVFLVTTAKGAELLKALDEEGRSIDEFKAIANAGGGAIELDGMLTLKGEAESIPLTAENVGAVLPGAGDLADEYIVVGGHLDHVGMGYFGSLGVPGTLHPGADDNASGSAGVLLLAEKLSATYANMDPAEPRRSILFLSFTGEESGLNGSRHYVQDPIVDLKKHRIMINLDMIGRIENDRIAVAGGYSGEGLQEWVDPYLAYENSGLDCVVPEKMSGASDHFNFYMNGIPVLFSVIPMSEFHSDYHTSTDTSDKINRAGAVKTVRMYHDIVRDLATKEELFAYVSPEKTSRRNEAAAPSTGGVRVRVGITPGNYDDSEDGVPIVRVSPGSSADKAGIIKGDRLVRWNGKKVRSVQEWMPMLRMHKGGDTVNIVVWRDGQEVTLTITLEGK